MKQKIYSLEKLQKILNKERVKRKKIVLCHGVFDLLHIGHIKHFREAKNLGDVLVVTLTPDKFVNKGPGKPTFNEKLRLEAIAALDVVDFVSLNTSPNAVKVIQKLKPKIYCKGPDYKNYKNDISAQIKNETNAVKKIGGKTIYTNDITFSSSKLLNQHAGIYDDQQKFIIKRIKKEYKFSQIKNLVENFSKLKILIIGEIIIDQYVFCDALGKSGKEPVLVLRDKETEEYLGGAAAISRHISSFCKKASLLSMVGEKGEYLQYIKKKLPKNIIFNYIKKSSSPTIIKKRFIDSVNKNKILGVYKINDETLNQKDEKLFNNMLKKEIPNYDLVIVSDYGHGLISKQSANLICKLSKYLALNAQVNAANIGYHSMKNYKNVNCVIINEGEIRHEMRNKNDKIELLMKLLSNQQNIKNLIVTRGTNGALLFNKSKKKFNSCEAFVKLPVDKVGAGDAMLSIIALCLKNELSKELTLLIGSLAAAQSVESIGNKESLNKIKILKSIENMLK